jgi:glucose-6-phosphate-specific signal transduction histidine kinase
MPNSSPARPWLLQLMAALGYGLGYSLFHDVLLSQYSLSFGFRLAVLAVMPYRYWRALLLGELVSCGYIAVTCADSFGVAWAVVRAFPTITLVMPVVYVCRERFRLFSAKRLVNVPILLLGALVSALITVPFQVGLLSLAHLPPNYPPLHRWVLNYFVMNYVGALTVAPVALGLRESWSQLRHRTLFGSLANSRLAIESMGMVLPVLAFLMWIGFNADTDSEVRHLVQIAMFLPVIAIALRHGWHGAAVGGAAAGLAIESLMPVGYDQSGLQAQSLIALVISTMLLMGRHVTVLNRQEQQERLAVRSALALAQQNFHYGELQFRRLAYALWDIQRSLYRVLHFGGQLSPAQSLKYDEAARPLVQKLDGLAQQLHPLPTAQRSLPIALRESAMARVLADYHVHFELAYYGGISTLSSRTHLVLYRLISDAIFHICDRHPVSQILVHVGCRKYRDRIWAAVRIEASVLVDQSEPQQSWRNLLDRLKQSSRPADFGALQLTAQTFGGRARLIAEGSKTRLSVLLTDPP